MSSVLGPRNAGKARTWADAWTAAAMWMTARLPAGCSKQQEQRHGHRLWNVGCDSATAKWCRGGGRRAKSLIFVNRFSCMRFKLWTEVVHFCLFVTKALIARSCRRIALSPGLYITSTCLLSFQDACGQVAIVNFLSSWIWLEHSHTTCKIDHAN